MGDPLWKFLLAGAAIYAADQWWASREDAGRTGEDIDSRIVIPASVVSALRAGLRKESGGAPTKRQERAAIDDIVRQEAMFREARRMGLDKNDIIIRRRLVQKTEFLAEGLAQIEEPSDADLEAWLRSHEDGYRRPASVSFEHVYFSRDRRGEHTGEDAARALRRLGSSTGRGRAAPSGGDLFLIEVGQRLVTHDQIARTFGPEFAAGVLALAPGRWEGPIESRYGLHLVRVTERENDRPATLTEVKRQVRNELLRTRQEQGKEQMLREMLSRYEVVVEEPRS